MASSAGLDGTPQGFAHPQPYLTVRVSYISGDPNNNNNRDSNGYYKCYLIQEGWLDSQATAGPNVSQRELRVNTNNVLVDDQTAIFGVPVTMTKGSPSPSDDGFILVKPIIAEQQGQLIGYLTGTTWLAKGSTGTAQIQDDQGNNIKQIKNVRAFFDDVEPGVINEVQYDPFQNEYFFVPMDVHDPRWGKYAGTAGTVGINAGSTGTIAVYDERGNNQLFNISAVWALNTIASNESVILHFDYVQDEWYAWAPNRPLIGKVGANTIVHGGNAGAGGVQLLDSKLNNVVSAINLVAKVWAPVVDLTAGSYILVFWDYAQKQFWGVPLASPPQLLSHYQYMSTPNVTMGSSSTFEIFTDQQVDKNFTVTARAFANIVITDWCVLNWDTTNNEYYAIPLNRPLIGKVSAISAGHYTVEVYNSAGSDQSQSLTSVINWPGTSLSGTYIAPVGTWVLVFWDWIISSPGTPSGAFYAVPTSVPAYGGQYGANGLSGSTVVYGLGFGMPSQGTTYPDGNSVTVTNKGDYQVSGEITVDPNWTPSGGADHDLCQVRFYPCQNGTPISLNFGAAEVGYRPVYTLSGSLIVGYTLNSLPTALPAQSISFSTIFHFNAGDVITTQLSFGSTSSGATPVVAVQGGHFNVVKVSPV